MLMFLLDMTLLLVAIDLTIAVAVSMYVGFNAARWEDKNGIDYVFPNDFLKHINEFPNCQEIKRLLKKIPPTYGLRAVAMLADWTEFKKAYIAQVKSEGQ